MHTTSISSTALPSIRDASDADLARLLPVRTADAVGELYRRFAPKLRANLAVRLGQGDADDVLQNVFLVVLREGRFRPAPGHVFAWLSGIANRLANQKKAELWRETPVASDAAICDAWIEDVDGPEPAEPRGRKKRRARRRRD